MNLALMRLARADRDAWQEAIMLPEPAREAAFALAAFGASLARIAPAVTTPAAGYMRLQFFREIIDGQRDAGEHPAMQQLLRAVAHYDLPVMWLMDMIGARQLELEPAPFATVEELEAWCGRLWSRPLAMRIRICGSTGDFSTFCGHAGIAMAIARMLVSPPVFSPWPAAWQAETATGNAAALAAEHLGIAMQHAGGVPPCATRQLALAGPRLARVAAGRSGDMAPLVRLLRILRGVQL